MATVNSVSQVENDASLQLDPPTDAPPPSAFPSPTEEVDAQDILDRPYHFHNYSGPGAYGEILKDDCGLPLTEKRLAHKQCKSRAKLARGGFEPFSIPEEHGVTYEKDFVMFSWTPPEDEKMLTAGGYQGTMDVVPQDKFRRWLTHICPRTKKILLDFYPIENKCATCGGFIETRKDVYAGVVCKTDVTGFNKETGRKYETCKLGRVRSVCKNTSCITALWKQVADIPRSGMCTESQLAVPGNNKLIRQMQEDNKNILNAYALNTVWYCNHMEMLYGTALADTGNVVGHFLNVLVNGAQGTEKSIHALAESGQFNGIILENARYAMHRCAEMLAQHILRYHNNVVSDYERRLKEASSAETLCALNKDAPDAKRQKLTHDARDETSENPVKEKPGMCAVGSGKTDEEVANGFLATSL